MWTRLLVTLKILRHKRKVEFRNYMPWKDMFVTPKLPQQIANYPIYVRAVAGKGHF